MDSEIKKLFRSRKDRVLVGVCGGLGKYFDIDSVLIRIIFILLTFARGFGILPYIILAVIIPLEPTEDAKTGFAESGELSDEKMMDFTKKAGQRAQELADELSKESQSIRTEIKQNENWWTEKKNMFGVIVIIIGFISLLNEFFPMHWLKWKVVASIAAIFVGLLIIFRNFKDKNHYGK